MVGQFVLSTAGRDKDRIHVVCSIIDSEYVLIADGKTRKINKPKKKKTRHIKLLGYKDEMLAEAISSGSVTDKQIISSVHLYEKDDRKNVSKDL